MTQDTKLHTHKYVCMYVCMYIMYVCMYVRMYVCMYVYYVCMYVVSCPPRARLPARNGLVNEVEFLGLIPQNGERPMRLRDR